MELWGGRVDGHPGSNQPKILKTTLSAVFLKMENVPIFHLIFPTFAGGALANFSESILSLTNC